MKLSSPAFANRAFIDSRYTCDGSDISPPLTWNDPPSGTVSLAIVCDDPDAPGGTWVHWLIYNLPPQTRSLPENIDDFPPGTQLGRNDFKQLSYGGPCPPNGIHRYFFKLYALDTVLDLPDGATKDRLEAAMEGHILTRADLLGRYQRAQ